METCEAEPLTSEYSQCTQELLARVGFPQSLPADFDLQSVIETHISVVLVGKVQALKFKKPVRFTFLDYSTLERRWGAAVLEVELNRRLSSGIYLGLLPFFDDDLGPKSAPLLTEFSKQAIPPGLIEAAVVMETLAAEDRLDVLLRRKNVAIEGHIERLAKELGSFHLNQAKVRPLSQERLRAGSLEVVAQEVFENIDQCRAACVLTKSTESALNCVEEYAKDYLASNAAQFRARDNSRYIVDGHGDLRAEHVYFRQNRVDMVDCIEFNDQLRSVDMLSDTAFIRMDLDRLERPDLGVLCSNVYRATVGEFDEGLLRFYSSYRAMVRAKVAMLSSKSLSCEASMDNQLRMAENYIGLACRYALGLDYPFVIAIGGLIGTGKSTLARHLTQLTGARLLQTDTLRKKIFPEQPSDRTLSFNTAKYSKKNRAIVYDSMFDSAREALQHSNPVIMDASFGSLQHRETAARLAKCYDAPFVFAHCALDPHVHQVRLGARHGGISDGRLEHLEPQRAQFEVPEQAAEAGVIDVDTADPVDIQGRAVISELNQVREEL